MPGRSTAPGGAQPFCLAACLPQEDCFLCLPRACAAAQTAQHSAAAAARQARIAQPPTLACTYVATDGRALLQSRLREKLNLAISRPLVAWAADQPSLRSIHEQSSAPTCVLPALERAWAAAHPVLGGAGGGQPWDGFDMDLKPELCYVV